MSKNTDIIKQWCERTIVELDLCPFAKIPFENNRIHFSEDLDSTTEYLEGKFLDQIDYLNKNIETIETTLWSLPNLDFSFEGFNDFTGLLEDLLAAAGIDHLFQLVCFHPEFVFIDTKFEDKANWVNRSPFPVIHILQTKDVEMALSKESMARNLSFLNEHKIKGLTPEEIRYFFFYM